MGTSMPDMNMAASELNRRKIPFVPETTETFLGYLAG